MGVGLGLQSHHFANWEERQGSYSQRFRPLVSRPAPALLASSTQRPTNQITCRMATAWYTVYATVVDGEEWFLTSTARPLVPVALRTTWIITNTSDGVASKQFIAHPSW